ncbi:hypothetical protein QYF61_018392 [Mycteria americana]|uniref:Uncharacterized protein n=1 Tax=Mycteria americana TaxID=33587 RepID=A0AAN7N9A8_MYCAM|nr:hypothetical protein QYF61_018392 [Mycteria americana]
MAPSLSVFKKCLGNALRYMESGNECSNQDYGVVVDEDVLNYVHKKLGGGTARIVDPNWPKGYSIPYDVMPSI